jgi:hypothetical protein
VCEGVATFPIETMSKSCTPLNCCVKIYVLSCAQRVDPSPKGMIFAYFYVCRPWPRRHTRRVRRMTAQEVGSH